MSNFGYRAFASAVAAFACTAGIAVAGNYYTGSKSDIAAVQAVEHRIAPGHNHVLGVHVIGDYALLLFWSGQTFQPGIEQHDAFKRSGHTWTRVYSGSNACTDMPKHGVPAAIARQLCANWGDVGS